MGRINSVDDERNASSEEDERQKFVHKRVRTFPAWKGGRWSRLLEPGHMMPGVIGGARRGLRGNHVMAGGRVGRRILIRNVVWHRRPYGRDHGLCAGGTAFDSWVHEQIDDF